MIWFYEFKGEPKGPVSEDQLRNLLEAQTINSETRLWKSGMPEWAPLSAAVPSLLPPLPSPVASFSDLPPLPNSLVIPESTSDGWISEEQLLAAVPTLGIGQILSQGWTTFFKNPGTLLGGTLLAGLLLVGIGSIPFLGLLLQLVLVGPLFGGLHLLYLRQIRTGSTEIDLVFAAFRFRFFQFMMVNLIPSLLNLVTALPLIIGLIMPLVGGALIGSIRPSPGEMFSALSAIGIIGAGALFFWILLLIGTLLLTSVFYTLWIFALPLVADKGYDFWPALQLSRKVVSKQFLLTFFFVLFLTVLGNLGWFACCLGILISYPVALCSLCHGYETLFGRLRPKKTTL